MVTRRASRQPRPLRAFALAAIIGGLIGTFAGLTSGISAADFSKAVDTEVLGRLQAAAVLPNGTAPDVLKSIREATVLIEAAGCDGQSTGTGVVIADGRVLTNRHVLADTSGARVTNLNGTSAGADRISASSIDDAAVISLPDHQSAPFGSGIKPDAQKGPHEGQTIIVGDAVRELVRGRIDHAASRLNPSGHLTRATCPRTIREDLAFKGGVDDLHRCGIRRRGGQCAHGQQQETDCVLHDALFWMDQRARAEPRRAATPTSPSPASISA